MSLLLLSCYWKIALHKSGGKPFDAGPVCISHTLTHTYTENTFHPPYPKPPVALAGICDPNPYFNFSPLMQTNSILVAFPQKRRAMWEMSLFSCCIYKGPNQRHFWAVSLSMSIMSKQAYTKADSWKPIVWGHNSFCCRFISLYKLWIPATTSNNSQNTIQACINSLNLCHQIIHNYLNEKLLGFSVTQRALWKKVTTLQTEKPKMLAVVSIENTDPFDTHSQPFHTFSF